EELRYFWHPTPRLSNYLQNTRRRLGLLGQAGRVILEVGGLQDLAEADVSNIEARLDVAPGVPLLQSSREVEPDIAGKTLLRLIFSFVAPSALGSFSATVTLPAVANISDTGLVIPK